MVCPRRRARTVAAGVLAAVLVTAATTLGAAPVHAADPDPSGSTSPGPDDSGVAGERPAQDASPLDVELVSMTPGTVPERGPIVLEGTVRNDSEEEWLDVQVLSFLGTDPLTTRDEVAVAAETPEEEFVGERLGDPGSFEAVGDLAPGEEVDYSVRVPAASLPDRDVPGVYWIGVHALGTDAAGRDSVADGRARTFVPVVPRLSAPARATTPPVPVTLVLPVRQAAPRDASGRLRNVGTWSELVSVDGRLDRLSRFALSAGSRPLTWLLDPAVLDAVDDLGSGNPALSLGGPDRVSQAGGPDQPSPQPDEAPSDPGGPPSSGSSPSGAVDPGEAGATSGEASDATPDSATRRAARDLLTRLEAQLARDDVLALPHADVDAVAVARSRPPLLARAYAIGQQRLETRGLASTPVVAPPDGLVDLDLIGSVISRLPPTTSVLMSDRGDVELPPAARLPSETTPDNEAGHGLLLSDARAGAGGPAPGAATEPLALRQRLLAEAALESTSGEAPRPIVVRLPDTWDPGEDWPEADFFSELDTDWLQLVSAPTSMLQLAPADLPEYPRTAREEEVSAANIAAARRLVRRAGVLDAVLANANDVLRRVTGAALHATSYAARTRPGRAIGSVRGLLGTVDDVLDGVRLVGTDFVTLSGGSGVVTVTVVNELEQPVTVGVAARTDEEVRFEPIEDVELGPEQRVTVRLPVSSEEGVHDVALRPVTSAGVPAGTAFEFVLRTSQVGRTVWYVMAGAGVIFLVTLLRRVRQRLDERADDRPPAPPRPLR